MKFNRILNPKNLTLVEKQNLLNNAVSPRPIALVNTINKNNESNIGIYSYYNILSINPMILGFSIINSKNNITYQNILNIPELTINIVSYDIIQQAFLSSINYNNSNKFKITGFTAISSNIIEPPRIGESKLSFECKVQKIISLEEEKSQSKGYGTLILCKILLIHINEKQFYKTQNLSFKYLDVIGVLDNYSCIHIIKKKLFIGLKPLNSNILGLNKIPYKIRYNTLLTKNDLAILANIEKLPTNEEIILFINNNNINKYSYIDLYKLFRFFIKKGLIKEAWIILFKAEKIIDSI
ncbi:MAG: flavin reductase [Candidatus Bostrichicola ureolyticus]|nr:MAG: flavin reductase [Candidatus Bostrichicola ureolyticus]